MSPSASRPGAETHDTDPPPRPMGRIFVAVILVEVVTLLALWWFQSTFSHG